MYLLIFSFNKYVIRIKISQERLLFLSYLILINFQTKMPGPPSKRYRRSPTPKSESDIEDDYTPYVSVK